MRAPHWSDVGLGPWKVASFSAASSIQPTGAAIPWLSSAWSRIPALDVLDAQDLRRRALDIRW